MKAELIPEKGGKPIPIARDVSIVGRREFCDVWIDHPSLSKRHCLLVKTDGLLFVRDLASTNGTRVNGQRVRWAALLPNDRISLGRFQARVYLGPDNAPSPSPGPPVAPPIQAESSIGFAPPTPMPFVRTSQGPDEPVLDVWGALVDAEDEEEEGSRDRPAPIRR